MKKYMKKLWPWIGIGVLALIAAGFYFYKNQQPSNNRNEPESQQSSDSKNSVSTEKTDNPQEEVAKNPDEGKPTPEINTALAELKNVTLTAYMMLEATTSIDGKTTIPAQSIQPYFYPQGVGVYSVQKQLGSSWIDVASNISYPGHGGIAGSFTSSTEDNINYRVVKIEKGRATAVSKTFVVKKSDLADGVETYN